MPNVILAQWLPHLTGSELRVVLNVCRRTYGFSKQEDRISLKQMPEGIKRSFVDAPIRLWWITSNFEGVRYRRFTS